MSDEHEEHERIRARNEEIQKGKVMLRGPVGDGFAAVPEDKDEWRVQTFEWPRDRMAEYEAAKDPRYLTHPPHTPQLVYEFSGYVHLWPGFPEIPAVRCFTFAGVRP